MTKIAVGGLKKSFATRRGELQALGGLELTVEEGEFCALVGPSGCGKTTLLRILAGLERPTAGQVQVLRRDPRRLATALVFQGPSALPWLTVQDNVAYGLWAQGVGRQERRSIAAQQLQRVGLAPFARAYPHQLSEGMRQRVAIARALAADPEVLLMDEPFGALDEQNRLLLQEELLRLWQDSGKTGHPTSFPERTWGPKTVVFVTHSIQEAVSLADRVLVLSAAPCRLKADLAVPFPRPRELQELRRSPLFGELVYDIWQLLREEVLRAREAQAWAAF